MGKYVRIIFILFNLCIFSNVIIFSGIREQQLFAALEQNNLNKVKDIVRKGKIDLNYEDKNGFTALMFASHFRLFDIVAFLLEEGADVNHKNSKSGNTALMCAIMGASKKIIGSDDNIRQDIENVVGWLLEPKYGGNADPNIKNNEGVTPLFMAITMGNYIIVRDLISYGAKIDEKVDGDAPLTFSIWMKNKEIVLFLIEKGTDINSRHDKHGTTPLMVASGQGYLDIVIKLIDKGADINAKDKINRTALSFAIKNNLKEIEEYLLLKGAH